VLLQHMILSWRKQLFVTATDALYYKHIMIVNDNSSVVSKWCSKLRHQLWAWLTTLVKAKAVANKISTVQASLTIVTYNRCLQSSVTIVTYDRHLQSSITIVTYDRHLWSSLTIITYDRHLQSSKYFYSTGLSFRSSLTFTSKAGILEIIDWI
jgi:hypothetical protein